MTALAETETPRTEWVNGVLIDLETGEVLATEHDQLIGEPFRIDSIERLEWVMERFANHEAQIVAHEVKRAAINAAIGAQIRDEERRLQGLHRRFDGEIEAFARAALDGGRTKTLKTAFGSVSFRVTQAAHKIVDQVAALAWARDEAPHLIRVKEDVPVSDLVKAVSLAYRGKTDVAFIETSGGGERMAIRTGVKSEVGPD